MLLLPLLIERLVAEAGGSTAADRHQASSGEDRVADVEAWRPGGEVESSRVIHSSQASRVNRIESNRIESSQEGGVGYGVM